ncbi:MAG: preprotein translocase subunit YajC [Alicyclobacillus sp.]|nr:preprotein translocase subunit YajC [Alicyclobacillus sp.]
MKMGNLILLVVMIAVFYALLILPQRRQQKNRQNMLRNLAPGAKVLSTAGIYGQIVSVHDDVLLVRVAPDVELEMDQRAIMRVIEPAPTAAEEQTPEHEG